MIKEKRKTSLLTIIVGSLFALYLFKTMFVNTPDTKPTEQAQQPPRSHALEAYTCAKMEVESLLKAPATAEFEKTSYSRSTIDIGNDQYIVASYVDAQNSFGATVRNNYFCKVKYLAHQNGCKSECYLEENLPDGWLEDIEIELRRLGKM